PTARDRGSAAQPAPLLALNQDGTPAPCAGYDANTFSYTFRTAGYNWTSLSVFPTGGSALAAGNYTDPSAQSEVEPVLARATCGEAPDLTRFQIPDPFIADQTQASPIPADPLGSGLPGSSAPTVVAANAVNDAWAAAPYGQLPASVTTVYLRPH